MCSCQVTPSQLVSPPLRVPLLELGGYFLENLNFFPESPTNQFAGERRRKRPFVGTYPN